MLPHLDRAVFTQSLAQTSGLIVAEVIKELLALRGRLSASDLAVDLTPGPAPLPEAAAQTADVLLCPVSIACQNQHRVGVMERVGGGSSRV